MVKTYKVVITGQVQGVGFRPSVYVLAKKFDLTGTVSNNEEGVIIYVTGEEEPIRTFINRLIKDPPPVARINSHSIEVTTLQHFDSFEIIPSQKGSKLNLQLTPDFAICPECAEEISDPDNRRYYYPFTTCVNCGPRWAITNTFPFERDHTSIVEFDMCEECMQEYSDPLNRRFHSQTNSCSRCGIDIQLTDNQGDILKYPISQVFKEIAELLHKGNIIALKNTSGFLLCCDATNKAAIQKLRDKKNRPRKPFAILYPNLEHLQKELPLSEKQMEALSSVERPIVIIAKTDYSGDLALTELVPGLNQLGIMMPYTGILQLLAEVLTMPIVATSGNLHGSPILSDSDEANKILGSVADYFVHHNLPISHPQDDSVVKYTTKFGHEVIFRRSRGYAPNYFGKEYHGDQKILAMGGHLKSTIGYVPNDYVYVSQYLGNLDNYDVYQRFEKTVSKFVQIFEQQPDTILVDAHPAYHSTQLGLELGEKLRTEVFKIQHHKAHFASVLGEHELFDAKTPILGVIWDGTGYGDDRQIWGGEFFRYHDKQIDRIAHLAYYDWLAGDKMAKEPRLSLYSLFDGQIPPESAEKFTNQELAIFGSIKKKNTLKTSSVGRLFDAVASLLNICDHNTYEGEAAILLENCISHYELENCQSYLSEFDGVEIPTRSLFWNLYSDYKNGAAKEIVITNFLYTLATLILQIAKKHELKRIALSGGVFQNTVLIDMLLELADGEYELFFNRNLSPNDENISFGQINYYLYCRDHEVPK